MRWIVVVVFTFGCVSAQRGELPSQRWPKNRQKRDEEFAELQRRVLALEHKVQLLATQPKPEPRPIDSEEPPKPAVPD